VFIPAGFIFDGASIPRLLWSVLSPVGVFFIPGLVHDFAYKYSALIVIEDGKKVIVRIDRKVSDMLFKQLGIRINGLGIMSNVSHFFLRCFGWLPWKNHIKRGTHILLRDGQIFKGLESLWRPIYNAVK